MARPPRTHVVRAGENAFRIALRYGVTVDDLAGRNQLQDPTKLSQGQRLVIPEATSTRTASAARGAEAEAKEGATRLDCGATRRSEPVEEPSFGRFLWPVDGVVVSKFGHVESERHDGIDIAAPLGTPIRAAARGRVRYAGFQEGYGEIVIVEHENDRLTIYAHNAKNCVSAGDVISAGDLLALVGQSGGANSPVVHFEVREGLKAVNPRRFLP